MKSRVSEKAIGCVMDFPAAWDYVRSTKPEQHHPQCSWFVTHGALLCDCLILHDEYERRAAVLIPNRRICTTAKSATEPDDSNRRSRQGDDDGKVSQETDHH